MVNIKTLLGKLSRESMSYIISSPLTDKAASSELSEPDWETILDIVEEIKQKNVSLVSLSLSSSPGTLPLVSLLVL